MSEGARIREWLRQTLEASGLSAAELARLAGVHKSTIFRALSDDYEYVPSNRTIARIAEAAQAARDLPSLAFDWKVRPLAAPYELSPSVWLEEGDPHQDFAGSSPIVPHPSIPEREQWVGKMRGLSMAPLFEDGDLLHVANYTALQLQPRTGDCVVLKRSRPSTGGFQFSARLVRAVAAGEIALSFASTDPRWAGRTVLGGMTHEADGIRYEVIGLVIGHYRERRIW